MAQTLIRWSSATLAALLCAACAPASRVVLLPQPNLSTAVTVSTASGSALLDSPYAATDVSAKGELKKATSSEAEVKERYPALVRLRPPAPQKFTLRFQPGTSDLTPESAGELDAIIASARARAGGEIVIVGHTDRQGDAAANDALSLLRANAIRDILTNKGFKTELIDAVGRGEREPAVPTEDDVVEPLNRRAEIFVR